MSTYITGGCKNGKSLYAQRLAKAAAGERPLYYVATMLPHDAEDDARVLRHRGERAGWGFVTLEQGRNILACLRQGDPAPDLSGAFLLDSVTALLSNEMFAPDGIHWGAHLKIADELTEFIRLAPRTVLVSDFIFSDAARYDELTEAYRANLAHIDRRMAQRCDNVLEIACGQVIVHKGVDPLAGVAGVAP